jgi:hypothetical protein
MVIYECYDISESFLPIPVLDYQSLSSLEKQPFTRLKLTY